MADDDTGQSELPLGDSDAVRRAEERAKAAERRAREAERKAKERDELEAKKKRDAELQSADDARRALAEAEKREKEAAARLRIYEEREQERVTAMLEKLAKPERERVERYRERLGDDFGSFVQEELDRASASAHNDGDAMPAADEATPPPPPPATPGDVRRRERQDGRRLEPWAKAELEKLGVDTRAAEKSLEVEKHGDVHRFVFPPGKMRSFMRERALKPTLLSQDEYEKLHR